MKTRTIEISLDTAKRLYEQGGEYRDIALTAFKEHELIGDRLPKTWEEFCKNYPPKKGECYMNPSCEICSIVYHTDNRNKDSDRNILPSRQAAEAHLALMQLHQLRDAWREGWLPDWNDDKQRKYSICSIVGELMIKISYNRHFLAFQDEKRANEFLTNFRELIEQAGDLI